MRSLVLLSNNTILDLLIYGDKDDFKRNFHIFQKDKPINGLVRSLVLLFNNTILDLLIYGDKDDFKRDFHIFQNNKPINGLVRSLVLLFNNTILDLLIYGDKDDFKEISIYFKTINQSMDLCAPWFFFSTTQSSIY